MMKSGGFSGFSGEQNNINKSGVNVNGGSSHEINEDYSDQDFLDKRHHDQKDSITSADRYDYQ